MALTTALATQASPKRTAVVAAASMPVVVAPLVVEAEEEGMTLVVEEAVDTVEEAVMLYMAVQGVIASLLVAEEVVGE